MKIAYQGIAGSYSESCAKEIYPNCETIPCKTFDECFDIANKDSKIKTLIPESNKTTGNIGVEYLIFKYRLNVYAEHFYSIKHNLLGVHGSKLKDIKDVYSHAQALSQSSIFIKQNNLSAQIYNLEIIKSNIQDNKENVTRFLLMGKNVFEPDFEKGNYITSMLFKLKSKPAALYSALSGFAINGVNLTKLQSFPEQNSFSSYFFLCELDGHIQDKKVKSSLEDLNFHCEDMHVLGVFKADQFRGK